MLSLLITLGITCESGNVMASEGVWERFFENKGKKGKDCGFPCAGETEADSSAVVWWLGLGAVCGFPGFAR